MNRPTRLLLESSRTQVTVECPPLFQGGEGGIYVVRDTPWVAKIYHQPSAERPAKLKAMLHTPLVGLPAGNGGFSIVWPKDRLLQIGARSRCVGYVMERVRDKRPLSGYYHPNLHGGTTDFRLLVRIARNVAASVRALHARGIVVGDLNESNVLAGADASVALVDTDSFQIVTPNAVFRSLVGKPEYTPPELHGVRLEATDRKPEHDAFSLAVLIFLLLMEGNHPFNAWYTGKGNRLSLEERMVQGCWPYARGRKLLYQPRRAAPPFDDLPPPLQALFRQCFEDGHRNLRARPTAAAWEQALAEVERLPNLNWPGGHQRVRRVSRVLRKKRWAEQFRLLWKRVRGPSLKLSRVMTPFRVFFGWTKTPQEQRWCFWSRVVVFLIVLSFYLLGWVGPFSRPDSPGPNDPQQSHGVETPPLWQKLQTHRPSKD